eukprot:Skav227881  [mRNA]  locus=scaffold2896:347105:347640:+ [translate_table: standard]
MATRSRFLAGLHRAEAAERGSLGPAVCALEDGTIRSHGYGDPSHGISIPAAAPRRVAYVNGAPMRHDVDTEEDVVE